MGGVFSKYFSPASPVEENYRVIGVHEYGTSVDQDCNGLKVFNRNKFGYVLSSSLYHFDFSLFYCTVLINQNVCFRIQENISSMLKWCQSSSGGHELLKRVWQDCPAQHDTHEENRELPFRLMQWNILADALASGKDNFIKCPPEALAWDTRKKHILEEMLTHSPDIICCQEVDHFEDFLKPKLEQAGYQGAFLPKPWSPCLDVQPNNGPDGCAIFFRRDKFELIDFKAVTLKTLTFWTNHVALFHVLRFKGLCGTELPKDTESTSQKRTFLVGTTHLKAKVGYEGLRVNQGKDLLSYLKPYSESNMPVIMCGDFNATPDEEVYRMFCEGKEPQLESAYSCLGDSYTLGTQTRQREPPYTTWCVRPRGETPKTVDYVWYSKSDFKLKKYLRIPSGEEIGENRLPSFHYPSDHFSQVCDFELLSSKEHSEGAKY